MTNKEVWCCASRGRNTDNPSDRRPGIELEQRLEINHDGVCNCITSVAKDAYVLERVEDMDNPKCLGNIYDSGGQAGNVYDSNKCAPCVPGFGAGGGGKEMKFVEEDKKMEQISEEEIDKYRIRKLTPRECFRLMDFTDEQFEDAEKVSSNTALYKAAGNSLIVNVLVGILGQMIEGREDYYKKIANEPIFKPMDNSVDLVDKIKEE